MGCGWVHTVSDVGCGWVYTVSDVGCGWVHTVSDVGCGWVHTISDVGCGWVHTVATLLCRQGRQIQDFGLRHCGIWYGLPTFRTDVLLYCERPRNSRISLTA